MKRFDKITRIEKSFYYLFVHFWFSFFFLFYFCVLIRRYFDFLRAICSFLLIRQNNEIIFESQMSFMNNINSEILFQIVSVMMFFLRYDIC